MKLLETVARAICGSTCYAKAHADCAECIAWPTWQDEARAAIQAVFEGREVNTVIENPRARYIIQNTYMIERREVTEALATKNPLCDEGA